MADKSFIASRRGGGQTEQRLAARVATTDGAPNNAGYGRGGQGGPTADELRAYAIGGGRGIVNPPFVNVDNTFQHQTNNVVTTPGDENVDIGVMNFKEAFRPNILDQYDTSTYHWKFYMVTPAAFSSGKILNTNDQIIIAESGVTDVTIDGVVIDSQVTPSAQTGTGISTNVKFNLLEPSGAGLLDKLYYQTLALGIGNWAVVPYYLELSFRARSPESSEAENGAPGELASLRWIWPVKLSDIKANVTTVGTKYEVTAILSNDFALSNSNATIPNTIVLKDLDDIKDAMKKLQYALNADQVYRMIGTASVPDSYKIIIDPKLSGFKITPSTHNTDSVRNDDTVNIDGKNGTFPKGMGIDKIIDSIIGQTEEAQKLVKNSDTAPGPGKSINAEQDQMKKFWRIITETRPLEFDPYRLDYAREFTYYVVQYDLGVLDVTTQQDSAGSSSIAAEKKRLETYLKKSILRKKYNYIFTGLNDQIINFDIKINSAMAAAVARMAGVYDNAAMADKGMVNQTNSVDEGMVTEKLRAAVGFLNTASTDEIAGDEGLTVAQTRVAIESSDLPTATKERYIAILNNAKPESRMNFVNAARNGGIDAAGRLASARNNARIIATPVREKTNEKNLNFLSDIDPSAPETLRQEKEHFEQIKGKLRPVARRDTLQSRQVGTGIESSSNSGIQKLSSAFATALHSSLDVSFANIKMTIKGDPFWLFPSPIAEDSGDYTIYQSLRPNQQDAIDFMKFAHFKLNDSVNVFGTDNFILIRFRTPRIFDVNDDEVQNTNAFTDIEMLSGIFKVTNIKNSFENGKFHQELECQLDNNINILNFTKQIEENAATQDVPVSPNELVANTSIPKDFSIKQRIMGKIDIPGVQSVYDSTLTAAEVAVRQGIQLKGPSLGSNIPTKLPSLPGLPDIFG